MPRQAKPFKYRGWWTTKAGGVWNKLCPDSEPRKVAERLLRELPVKRDSGPAAKPAPLLAVWELCDQFLDSVKLNRAERTFQDYRDCLRPWVKLHGKKLARDVAAPDLVGAGLSACTVNHHVVAVQACWSWAAKMDLLAQNPLRKVERLDAEGRQRTLTPEEFRALLRSSDRLFREVLLVIRLTGVRPGEFCRLTWEQVNWTGHCWVIRKHKARRTAKEKKPRVILMPPIVEKLLLRRLRQLGHTPETRPPARNGERVFLNRRGKPWTVNALRCRMRRARAGAGLGPDESGERVVMYTNRHTYATEAVASGAVTDRRLGDLMGHTPGSRSTQRVHPPRHLRPVPRRAGGHQGLHLPEVAGSAICPNNSRRSPDAGD